MRVTRGDLGAELADLTSVQAYRLGHPALHSRQAEGRIDPFPHGRGIDSGLVVADGPDRVPGLLTTLLRSMDGGLPDYLIEAMYRGIHDDDTGLYDFLGIFDRRLQDLHFRVKAEIVLVAEADATRTTPRLRSRLARMLGREDREDLLPILAAMRVRARNIEVLQRIVAWWTGQEANAKVIFDAPRAVDGNVRSRIGKRTVGQNNALGHGAMLGRMGHPTQGRIEIELSCKTSKDLSDLQGDAEMLSGLAFILDRFLRDPIPLAVFAKVTHADLARPRLKGRGQPGTKLGAYNCLCPEKHPSAETRIRLNLSPGDNVQTGDRDDEFGKVGLKAYA